MTLIITELSPLGITMAADTAQTMECLNTLGRTEDRAFSGLTKILPVMKLQAGLSYWGWAMMPPNSKNGPWTDWWLRSFIANNEGNFESIGDLAALLEKELRKIVPPLKDDELKLMPFGNGGVHLAGYTDIKDKRVPCFWHIHNGLSQALPDKKINPKIENANFDIPPEKYLEFEKGGATVVIRNGDIEAYATLFEKYLKQYFLEARKEMDIVIPLPTIVHRSEFWRAQIRFISELYGCSGVVSGSTIKQMSRDIGEEVTVLIITKDGIRSYYTR